MLTFVAVAAVVATQQQQSSAMSFYVLQKTLLNIDKDKRSLSSYYSIFLWEHRVNPSKQSAITSTFFWEKGGKGRGKEL